MDNRLIVDSRICDGCGACIPVCPEDALILPDSLIEINLERCNLCLNCLIVCPVKALSVVQS